MQCGPLLAQRGNGMSRHTVVIVEMEPQIADAYELFLASRGWKVTAVSSMGHALREVLAREPHVVVIGNLPDSVEAGSVAARMRAVVAPRALAVVVLAASMDEVPNADVVAPRGAHPRAVMDAIRTALRRRQVTAPLATAS
jgi:DNA-binding response OmpR family regulator